MYKIYKTVNRKTNICGYWLDDNGILYKDNIIIEKSYNPDNIIKNLFRKNEIAVFAVKEKQALFNKVERKAIIIYKNGKKQYLNNRTEKIVNKKELKKQIVGYCQKFGGVTVYDNGKRTVKLEIWS